MLLGVPLFVSSTLAGVGSCWRCKQPRWQRIGRAARTGDAEYIVDLRGSDIGPDQLDSLRLAGLENDGVETNGFAVSEMVQNGSLLTLRVAEFADVADPHLWTLKQPPTCRSTSG
ncbi:hypothetical protein [Streptomyces atratus]|uniref:hypothetical protein n=1 Tax=Streptomyces atratus TaxID=1893 RepID=UPI0036505C97